MSTATITSKGQITIPKSVRQRLGVNPGDRVEFVERENGAFQLVGAVRDIHSLKAMVPTPKKAVSTTDMKKTIAARGGK
ncbi:MAG: AbrB/MazE/SpoVT family DNA-binding domain-containing protein [Ectothiorhodospiraceae bacterium]|nr:AbrB/MazE/SpoVT family DNA-binding domain-containing protein [Ectothiorhodospiraceae bacterium]